MLSKADKLLFQQLLDLNPLPCCNLRRVICTLEWQMLNLSSKCANMCSHVKLRSKKKSMLNLKPRSEVYKMKTSGTSLSYRQGLTINWVRSAENTETWWMKRGKSENKNAKKRFSKNWKKSKSQLKAATFSLIQASWRLKPKETLLLDYWPAE